MFGPEEQLLSDDFEAESEESSIWLARNRCSMHTGGRKEHLNERIPPESGCG